MYWPPPLEKALKLADEIEEFLVCCGGHYLDKGIDQSTDEHILSCVATGQFFYCRDKYFVGWWMVDEMGLQGIERHNRPEDIRNGDIMYITEFGLQDRNMMPTIIRKLRKRGKNGVHWHRSGKGWRHFPAQKGACHG